MHKIGSVSYVGCVYASVVEVGCGNWVLFFFFFKQKTAYEITR